MNLKEGRHLYLLIIVGVALLSLLIVVSSESPIGKQFIVGSLVTNETSGRQIIAPKTCLDPDQHDITSQGSCFDETGKKTDYCASEFKLVEYECSGNSCTESVFNCLQEGYVACFDGACQNTICGNGIIDPGELCDNNSQACIVNGYNGTQFCNDNCDGYGSCSTEFFCGDGICNGPETIQSCQADCITHLECIQSTCTIIPGPGESPCSPEGSYCNDTTNETLQCDTNSDCPFTTQFPFCNQNFECVDVKEYVCSNGGTNNSYCELGIGTGGCQLCEFGCSEGLCINETHIECISNACVIMDSPGIDECLTPTQPFCVDQHLECINNACTLVIAPGVDECSPAGSQC